MQHVFAILLRLVVGNGVAAVTVAVVSAAIDVAMFEDAGTQGGRVGAVVQDRIGVKIGRGKLAVLIATAWLDGRVAVQQAAATIVIRRQMGVMRRYG